MDTKTLTQTLTALFSQPDRTTVVMLSGPPGIGKTSIPVQVAAAVRKPVSMLPLPTCEAVDLRGLPYRENGQTRWASPLPREGQGVLILDEVTSCPADVQAAAHHIVWAEAGSDMCLPAGWHLVLTGNGAQHKTLYRPMSGPLRNRLTFIEVEAHPLQWAEHASRANVHPFIVGFIRWLPDALTVKEIPADGAFPSPRSWFEASAILRLAVSADAERELLSGTVGQAAAVKFCAYLEMARKLPSIERIMAEPTKVPVPKEPSLCYALTCSLGQYTRMNSVSGMEYVARMPAEYGGLYLREIRDHYKLEEDEFIRQWIGKHKTMFKDDAE